MSIDCGIGGQNTVHDCTACIILRPYVSMGVLDAVRVDNWHVVDVEFVQDIGVIGIVQDFVDDEGSCCSCNPFSCVDLYI